MSTGKKTGSKAGNVHRKTRQAPTRQGDPGVSKETPGQGKPDFDEKDAGIAPTRKAPGPEKRRRSRARAGAPRVGSHPPNPEARINQDDEDSE